MLLVLLIVGISIAWTLVWDAVTPALTDWHFAELGMLLSGAINGAVIAVLQSRNI
jgi:hypothetical protein